MKRFVLTFAISLCAMVAAVAADLKVVHFGGGDADAEAARKIVADKYPGRTAEWIDAVIPGTGTDLGAFRLEEDVLRAAPDVVVVDFPADSYAPALGSIMQRLRKALPDAGVYLIGAKEPAADDFSAWDSATMYAPAEICKRHGLWKDVAAAGDSRMKAFAGRFPSVLTSGHPKSTLSFAFEGDMFGLFDIAGPEGGQLEVYVDGQMIRMKNLSDGALSYRQSMPLTGTHYLNLFTADSTYRLHHDLIHVGPGIHQVTLKISDKNPALRYLMLGRILVRGKVAECRPVKGLPKMEQQLKWEKKINKYMERDEEQAALEDATLVVGSSSIDMWKSLETDFPGHNVIRRGVSGTKAIDLYNYRDLLIAPFNPKRIIIYEGDNEIGFKWSTDEMMEWMEKLFHEVRRMKPDAEIYLVSVKPSPVRASRLGEIQEFNRRLREFAESQPRTGYIDIHTPMLDAEGKVRPELFLADRLHPAKEGYDIWIREFAKVIK